MIKMSQQGIFLENWEIKLLEVYKIITPDEIDITQREGLHFLITWNIFRDRFLVKNRIESIE